MSGCLLHGPYKDTSNRSTYARVATTAMVLSQVTYTSNKIYLQSLCCRFYESLSVEGTRPKLYVHCIYICTYTPSKGGAIQGLIVECLPHVSTVVLVLVPVDSRHRTQRFESHVTHKQRSTSADHVAAGLTLARYSSVGYPQWHPQWSVGAALTLQV